ESDDVITLALILASFREPVQQQVGAFLGHVEDVQVRVTYDEVSPRIANADDGLGSEMAVDRVADHPLPYSLFEYSFERLAVAAPELLQHLPLLFRQVQALVVVDFECLVFLAIAREVRSQGCQKFGLERL